jgi:soluble lytic murein transglycosylase-like protein
MAYTKAQLIALVQQYAASFGIDPQIAYHQIKRESANFRSDVVYGPFVGGAGERGMSQFTPGTWQRFGSGPHTNAYNPDAAMTAWGKYMAYLLRMFGGDYTKALQGYNGGEGHVQRGTVSSAAKRYASEIIAQAGSSPAPAGAARSDNQDDGWVYYEPDPSIDYAGSMLSNNWLTIGLVGLIVLVLLLSDD